MAGKGRVLVVGSTGYIGKFIVEASAKAGHQTYALVRDSALSDPAKSPIIHSFNSIGVTILTGDLFDHESLVKAIKLVDVVISAVGLNQLSDQDKLISAIKEAGNVKRFFPSEFGFDVENVHGVGPVKSVFEAKVKVRRAVEDAGIPYTWSTILTDIFFPNWLSMKPLLLPETKLLFMGMEIPKSFSTRKKTLHHSPLKLWMIQEL